MSNREVLVVNPWFCDFKGYDEWSRPLGLLYVAAVLEREGWHVTFVDCLDRNHRSLPESFNESAAKYGCGKYPEEEIEKPPMYRKVKRRYKRYGISEAAFLADLRDVPPPAAIIVGSLVTFWYEGPFRAIGLLKRLFPGTPVVLGGIYATLCREHAVARSGADFVVRGHDIDGLLSFLSDLSGVRPKRSWNGFANYPAPLYGLLDRPVAVPVMTSMGCPFRCSYCASSILNGGFSGRDPVALAEELAPVLMELGVSDVAFYDDALLVDYFGRTGAFVERLNSLGFRPRFHTPNAMHARYVDDAVAESLREHGFVSLRLGFEFSDEDMMRRTGGKVRGGDVERAASALRRAGFRGRDLKAYLLAGVPGTDAGSVESGLRRCHDLGLTTHISEYSPIPGTVMWSSFPGVDSEEAGDPLFHNNTYHIYNGTVMPLDEYDRLKSLSRSLNSDLCRGCD